MSLVTVVLKGESNFFLRLTMSLMTISEILTKYVDPSFCYKKSLLVKVQENLPKLADTKNVFIFSTIRSEE